VNEMVLAVALRSGGNAIQPGASSAGLYSTRYNPFVKEVQVRTTRPLVAVILEIIGGSANRRTVPPLLIPPWNVVP